MQTNQITLYTWYYMGSFIYEKTLIQQFEIMVSNKKDTFNKIKNQNHS